MEGTLGRGQQSSPGHGDRAIGAGETAGPTDQEERTASEPVPGPPTAAD